MGGIVEPPNEKRIQRLTETLWADFEIAYGKRLRRKVLAANDQDREALAWGLELRNLFLLRRAQDPGFSRFVAAQVRESPSAFSKVKRYIAQTYASLDAPEEGDLFFPGSAGESGAPKDLVVRPTKVVHPFEGIVAIVKGFEENRQKTLEYLKWRAERALEAGDEDELASVDWFRREIATDLLNADVLFAGHELYGGLRYRWAWHLERAKFMTLNIRYSRFYFSGFSPAVAIANMLVFEKRDVARLFLDALKELDASLAKAVEEDPLRWNKYVGNAESIAAVTWFASLPAEEQIAILNRFYDFRLGKEEVTRYLDDLPEDGIVALAQSLFANQFYREAQAFYETGLGKARSARARHVCADGAATALRCLMEFGDARRLYERVLEIVGEAGFPDSTYAGAVAHKNVGEMAHRVGDKVKGNWHFEECRSLSASLAASRKAVVVWNLACAHRRIGDYDKELRYVNEALDLGLDEHPNVKEAALSRLGVLNDPAFVLPDGKCNAPLVATTDLREEIADMSRRASAFFGMFQFARAREWHSLCGRLEDSEVHPLDVAECLYLEGRLAESRSLFDASLRPGTRSVFGLAYRGLIEFADGDADRGRDYLRRSLERCAEVVDNKEYFASLWDHVLRELLLMKGEEVTRKVMKELSRSVSPEDVRPHFLNTIGERFSGLGFLDASLECFHTLFELDLSPQSNAMALLQRGTILSRWGRFQEATKELNASLALLDFDGTRLALAESYAWTLDFGRAAETLRVALGRHPDNRVLLRLLRRYEELAKEVPNLNAVEDPEVVAMLRSAEVLALKSLDELDAPGSFDYSLSLVEYGKAAETLLHRRVGLPARDMVLSIHGGNALGKDLRAPKGPASLPPPVRDLLGSQARSIGVGGWARIAKDSSKNPGNPVYGTFLKEVSTRLKSGGLDVVGRACSVLSRYRNPSAHHGVVTKEGVQAVRKEIVTALNEIIQEVYP